MMDKADLFVDLWVEYKPGYLYHQKINLKRIDDLNLYIEDLARNLIRDYDKRNSWSVVCPHIRIRGKTFDEYDKCAEFYADTRIYCEICKRMFSITLDTDEGTVKIEDLKENLKAS